MPDDRETVITSNRQLFDWGEFWGFRELFYFFVWRDVKIRYKQTVLGFLWAVLQPLFMMIVFTFFFGKALRIPSQNIPYPVFVFSGLLVWNMFSTGLMNASQSMIGNATIIKKIYFPRIIIPFSSVIVAMFDFVMAFILFIPLLFFYEQPVSIHALWLWPVSVGIAVIATAGPGSLIAALNVKYRDFRYVIPFMIQVLFFITPIVYPVSMLSFPVLKYLVVISPMYAAIELFRFPLTGALPEWQYLSVSFASALSFLIIGISYFKRTERFFADFA